MSATSHQRHMKVRCSQGQKTLDLSDKQLTILPHSVTRMCHLEALILYRNQLTELPSDIDRLTELRKLEVEFNNLISVPDSIGSLKELTILKLTNNRLSEVPSSISCLENLQELHLARNHLVKLPDRLGNLKSLHSLYLDHNQLSTIPSSVTALIKLQKLELGHNKIYELPKTFGLLQNLTIFNVECNQLTACPPSITNLENLEQLILAGNGLTHLPEDIGHLASLTILEAPKNRITELPFSITKLKRLQRLELGGNRLKDLPIDLSELTSLSFLDLSNNPLSLEAIRYIIDLKERQLERSSAGTDAPEGSFSATVPGRTLILEHELNDEGASCELTVAAAHLMFPPQAVTEPQLITCSLWNPRMLSPPLGHQEALVSNVIELSRNGVSSLESSPCFMKEVTLCLSHSASKLEGYEIVIKQLIDKENNQWQDLETANTWQKASAGSSETVLPFAEAKVTQCSTFAAIWRLRTFMFSGKATSATPGNSFNVPDYPKISVIFPYGATSPSEEDISIEIKVQEVPHGGMRENGVLPGPILRLSCSHNTEFSKPITITIPVSLREDEKEIPELMSSQLRIFHQNSDLASSEWSEITAQMESPPEMKDGVVTFQVRHFSVFWLWLDWCTHSLSRVSSHVSDTYKRSMPQEAAFTACLCETSPCPPFQLALCCYPVHIREQVKRDMLMSYVVVRHGEGNSLQPMCKGDKANIRLGEALIPTNEYEIESFFVRFLGDERFLRSELVNVAEDNVPQVQFSRPQYPDQRSELLCNLLICPLPHVNTPTFFELYL